MISNRRRDGNNAWVFSDLVRTYLGTYVVAKAYEIIAHSYDVLERTWL